MNDRRLNELIRMAGEVSAIERDAEAAPTLRLVGAEAEITRVRVSGRRWIGLLSVAAAVALAAVGVWWRIAPGGSSAGSATLAGGQSPHARTPADPPRVFVKHQPLGPAIPVQGVAGTVVRAGAVEPVPGTPDESVVLAIYRDNVGGLRCVQLAAHSWANRCLPDVQARELRDVRFGAPCTKEPQETLLIALAGPRRSLPTSEAGAVALAKCILSMPRGCDGDAACFSGPASQCVPAGVSVKIEAVADRGMTSERFVP